MRRITFKLRGRLGGNQLHQAIETLSLIRFAPYAIVNSKKENNDILI